MQHAKNLAGLAFFLFLAAAACGLTGDKIAVLLPADDGDFGYNLGIVEGVRAMEEMLNISGTKIIFHVETKDVALGNMTLLIDQGYTLIVSGSSSQGDAAMTMALSHPNVYFAQVTWVGSPPPNLYTMTWSAMDMFYSLGAFAGAISTNGVVGFVHPGLPAAPLAPVNAFFLGAKSTNPGARVHLVTTGSFVDPDVGRGAAEVLLGETIGTDVVASQLDDTSVEELLMDRGILSIGTSGYPMRKRFGQDVGISIVRDWKYHFATLVKSIRAAANGTWTPKGISGSFGAGNVWLDKPSYRVTADQMILVDAQISLLTGFKTPYYCGPLVESFGLNPETGCLPQSNMNLFSQNLLPWINHWGTYKVPVDTVVTIESARTAMLVIAALGIFISMAIQIVMLVGRNYASIRAGDIPFLHLICVGCDLVFAGVISWAVPPETSGVCASGVWLISLGFSLAIGPMGIKNVRIWFLASKLKKVTPDDIKKINRTNMLIAVAVIMVLNIVLLAAYTAVGGISNPYIQGVEGLGKYEQARVCVANRTGTNMIYVLIAFHGILLMVGAVVAIMVKDAVLEELKESVIMGNIMFVVTALLGIAIALLRSSDTTHAYATKIVGFFALACAYGCMGMLFVPKLFNMAKYGKEGVDASISGFRWPSKNAPARTSTLTTLRSSRSTGSSNGRSSNKEVEGELPA